MSPPLQASTKLLMRGSDDKDAQSFSAISGRHEVESKSDTMTFPNSTLKTHAETGESPAVLPLCGSKGRAPSGQLRMKKADVPRVCADMTDEVAS